MEHTVFAAFRDPERAERAVQLLLSSDLCKDRHVRVVVHRGVDPARLDNLVQNDGQACETDGAPSAVRGALIGGTLGAGIGGLLDLIGIESLTGVLFGAWMGAALGALAGGLIGLGGPDTALRRLAGQLRCGDTLITVHTDNRERELLVEAFLERHRARAVEKHLVIPAAVGLAEPAPVSVSPSSR